MDSILKQSRRPRVTFFGTDRFDNPVPWNSDDMSDHDENPAPFHSPNSARATVRRDDQIYYFTFVYGTLKKGFANHHLLGQSFLIGAARTTVNYALYCEKMPYAVKTQHVSPLIGEVYRIDQETLRRIDRLEGHPDWNCREVVTVTLQKNQRLNAWIYFHPEPRGKLVPTGEFTQAHLR